MQSQNPEEAPWLPSASCESEITENRAENYACLNGNAQIMSTKEPSLCLAKGAGVRVRVVCTCIEARPDGPESNV